MGAGTSIIVPSTGIDDFYSDHCRSSDKTAKTAPALITAELQILFSVEARPVAGCTPFSPQATRLPTYSSSCRRKPRRYTV